MRGKCGLCGATSADGWGTVDGSDYCWDEGRASSCYDRARRKHEEKRKSKQGEAFILLLIAVAVGWAACQPTVDYGPGEPPDAPPMWDR